MSACTYHFYIHGVNVHTCGGEISMTCIVPGTLGLLERRQLHFVDERLLGRAATSVDSQWETASAKPVLSDACWRQFLFGSHSAESDSSLVPP